MFCDGVRVSCEKYGLLDIRYYIYKKCCRQKNLGCEMNYGDTWKESPIVTSTLRVSKNSQGKKRVALNIPKEKIKH
jgi:hypothetical protein